MLKGGGLWLSALKEIDAPSACELGSLNGDLHLGLKEISNEVAAGLGCGTGNLNLNSIESLSQDAAVHLIKRSGAPSLDGLTNVSLDVVKILAQKKGELSLGGLISIGDDAALELSKLRSTLRLHGLEDLSDKAAEHLSSHRVSNSDDLLFLSIPKPRESLFEIFSKHEGNLMLGIGSRPFSFRKEDTRTIEPKEAEWITKHKGKVTIQWVDALKDSALQILKVCPSIEGVDYNSIEILKETSKELKRKGT